MSLTPWSDSSCNRSTRAHCSHLLERLTRDALDKRMRNWVEADWRNAAATILENRLNGGKETEEGPDAGIFEL